MTMANLVPTPDGRFFDPVSGQIFLDQAGMQPDMSGEALGNFGAPVQGPVQSGQVRSDIPTGPIETPWSPAATNQVQTTNLTPSEISFMSPEAIARARSETPGMREFDFYNMMQAAPGVRALGSTGRQIAQRRLPELQTRFGLGQYFGDMPGQGQDTFRGFSESQPTTWGGQDWQNAMGGLRKGGMVSQAIEGYADMTPEQQFEQRTKFLAGMSGNEKGNLMNLNNEGGRKQVVAMIKGMLGGSDLPAGMRGWMDTAIEEEIAKLERDQPDLTTNPSNLLLHMSMNGFDLNGLGNPPEQKAISPYTDTKSVQAETNKATASDKAAANVTLENAATPTVENKPAITADVPTTTDKTVKPEQKPEITRAIQTNDTSLLPGLGGEDIPTGITTPTRAPQTKPLDTPTTPDTGLLPGLGGEGIPTGMPSPVAPPSPIGQAGGGGGTPPITPDTGMLPGLGGDAIPSCTPSAVAQPQPTTLQQPLPGLGGGEFNIPQASSMPQPSIMPATPDMAGVQPTPLGGARTVTPGQVPTQGGFGAAPAAVGDVLGMGQIAPGGAAQPFAPTPTNVVAPTMPLPVRRENQTQGGLGYGARIPVSMPGITSAPTDSYVTPGTVAPSAQNIFAEGQYGKTMQNPSALTGDMSFGQLGGGEFGGETPAERAAAQAQISAMTPVTGGPSFQDRLYGDLRGNGVQRTPNYGQSYPQSPQPDFGAVPATVTSGAPVDISGGLAATSGIGTGGFSAPPMEAAGAGYGPNVQNPNRYATFGSGWKQNQNPAPYVPITQELPAAFNPNAGPITQTLPGTFNPNSGPAVTSIGNKVYREDYGNPYDYGIPF